MIHALNFTGARDLELTALMSKTIRKYCSNLASLTCANMDEVDNKAWGNGASWEAALLKIEGLRKVVNDFGVADDDWILSVDSDVIFCNGMIFEFVSSLKEEGIVGIQQEGPLANSDIGGVKNMSGCSIYLRGHIVKKILALSSDELKDVRNRFKMFVLCENEDVVVSYLAQMLGAVSLSIPKIFYYSDDGFETDFKNGVLRSFYHLNYYELTFFGVPNTKKWEIPRVLGERGIEL